ncbi:MAG: hypothetical protein ACPGRZ_04660 [Alphaproteobacteria bacterium]
MLFDYILVSALAVAAVFAGALLAGPFFSGAERARIVVANRDEPRIGS